MPCQRATSSNLSLMQVNITRFLKKGQGTFIRAETFIRIIAVCEVLLATSFSIQISATFSNTTYLRKMFQTNYLEKIKQEISSFARHNCFLHIITSEQRKFSEVNNNETRCSYFLRKKNSFSKCTILSNYF